MASNHDVATLQRISQANNNFSLDIYQHLATEPGDLFLSPFSIQIILALLYFGASGDTQKQLHDALYLPNDEDSIEDGLAATLNELKDTSAVTLDIASKIYLQRNFTISSGFRSSAEHLDTETEELDFVTETEESRDEINDWVEDKTNGKITDLIPEGALSALTRMVLVNAIYFKGNWTFQFDENLTTAMPFHSSCAETTDVDTMYMKNKFNYTFIRELQAQAIALPYKGDEMSMVILLPKNINGISDLEAKLSNIEFADILDQLHENEVSLFLPKFTLKWDKELTSVLEQMGITSAFSGDADFSGISENSEGLQLSNVFHKAFIEVNEEGTEAAAATGGTITLTAVNQQIFFRANHPFLFFIIENNTKIILFLGRYSGPK